MAASRHLREATPLAEELRQYVREEGRREAHEEGLREGREEGRREEREAVRLRLLDTLEDAIAFRVPGTDTEWLRGIRDLDRLFRLDRELLLAADAKAFRTVVSRHAASR